MGRRASILIVVALVCAAGACGRGADDSPVAAPSATITPAPEFELPAEPSVPSGRPSSAVATRRASAAAPTGFSETEAKACDGRPTVQQVGALVKSIIKNAAPTAAKGPLCAGTWQYTVLTVPDAEPLQVVSRGQPGALVLVTAGTNPCTATVRGAAPPGLLTVIGC